MTVEDVLVTGATGRIGSLVTRRLTARGFVVHRAVRSGALRGDRDVQLELGDERSTSRSVTDLAPAAVVHLGAMVGPSCEADPVLARTINVDATARLARAAADSGTSAFVLMSSAAVYGSGSADAPPAPVSVYGRTKLDAEHALEAVVLDSDLAAVALRAFNVFGTGMGSLPELLARPGGGVTLHGLDSFIRDYVHAVEVAEAVVRAVQQLGSREPERFAIDLGTGRPTSNRRLVTDLGLVEGRGFVVCDPVESRSVADIGPLRRWLGWTPTAWPGSLAAAALDDDRS